MDREPKRANILFCHYKNAELDTKIAFIWISPEWNCAKIQLSSDSKLFQGEILSERFPIIEFHDKNVIFFIFFHGISPYLGNFKKFLWEHSYIIEFDKISELQSIFNLLSWIKEWHFHFDKLISLLRSKAAISCLDIPISLLRLSIEFICIIRRKKRNIHWSYNKGYLNHGSFTHWINNYVMNKTRNISKCDKYTGKQFFERFKNLADAQFDYHGQILVGFGRF